MVYGSMYHQDDEDIEDEGSEMDNQEMDDDDIDGQYTIVAFRSFLFTFPVTANLRFRLQVKQ